MIENGFEVAPETLYDLIGTIYRSSDAFVSNFDENYPTIAELADHIVTLSKKPGNVLLVDSIGKKKLGFLHIEPRGPHKLRHTAELTMGVSPEARGLGIGRELLDAALEKLRADGIIEILYLTVRADNIAAIRLYEEAAVYAATRGIIIADTKFEFGIDAAGTLHLIDEALTPDSSRFWPADSYAEGSNPPSFDKQFVRDWLESTGWNKEPPAPAVPADVAQKTADKYREALTRLTA